MLVYVLKLLLLLPVLGGMIWGSLWLSRNLQSRLAKMGGQRTTARSARLVETTMLGPGMKLAVIEFHGREILVGASRQGLVRLAEARPGEADAEMQP